MIKKILHLYNLHFMRLANTTLVEPTCKDLLIMGFCSSRLYIHNALVLQYHPKRDGYSQQQEDPSNKPSLGVYSNL